MLYQLDKPKLDFETLIKLVQEATRKIKDPATLPELVDKMNNPEYLCWDKVKYKPRPESLTNEEVWALVKFSRQWAPSRVLSPIKTPEGKQFAWQTTPWMQQFFHEVDLNLGGELVIPTYQQPVPRQRLISRGIIEEAIASSQLEGAATTRKAAKQMILEKRRPRNHSERMILNNYNAMLWIEDHLRQSELSLNLLLELHSILTKDTLEPEKVGALREDSDSVVVADLGTGTIYHQPPHRNFVDEQLPLLLEYSNDKRSRHAFEHPLTKAVALHFWVGYLHQFFDGNGRLARALFYWYMLRKNYWAFTYLPISRGIKASPGQYRDASIHSEQDDNDLTYFLDYNLRKVRLARDSFLRYLERKHDENAAVSNVARSRYNLNDRQIQLLRYLYKNSESRATITVHSHVNSISRVTARKDLELLEDAKFLRSEKQGRERAFVATEKVAALFEKRR